MASAGGGGGKSKSKTKDLAPREYKQQRGFVADQLRDRVSGNVNQIAGPFVAPITDDEKDALAVFKQGLNGPGGLGSQIDSSLSGLLNGGQDNPFLQDTINAAVRPILQNAQLQELRDRASFTGAGQKIQGSGAFVEDRNRAVRDTEQTIADTSAQIAFQDFAQRRQVQLEAVNLANLRLSEQKEGISAFALPRLIEQFGIDKANEELQRRFQTVERSLELLAQLTTPSLGSFSKSSQGQGNASVLGG